LNINLEESFTSTKMTNEVVKHVCEKVLCWSAKIGRREGEAVEEKEEEDGRG